MKKFKGFPEGTVRLIRLPEQFFVELLPAIENLDELKLSIYVFWRLERMPGKIRFLRRTELASDTIFMSGLSEPTVKALDNALELSVQRGTLLTGEINTPTGVEPVYFLNAPQGRAALKAIQAGEWRDVQTSDLPIELTPEPPNIFRLYEENIGPLTPLIADSLQVAEEEYPLIWIAEAFQIAVKNNKRNWAYIQAILRRWHEEGRDERKDRRDAEKARRRYAEWEEGKN